MGKEKYSLCTRRILGFFRPVIVFGGFLVFGWILKGVIPILFSLPIIGSLMIPGIMTISIFVCCRFVDKRSFKSLGLRISRFSLSDICLGFCTIILSTVPVFFANWAVGWIEPKDISSLLGNITVIAAFEIVMTSLFTTLLTGWWEELLFRGYIFKNIAWNTGVIFGAVLTSAIFGISHIGNYLQQNLTIMDCLSIAVDAAIGGLLMVFAYIRTRNLWMSIGLHTGWNFLMGRIMGLGIPQGSRPGFVGNLFGAPNVPMNANDIAILGIAAVLVFLVTKQRNRHMFLKGIAK